MPYIIQDQREYIGRTLNPLLGYITHLPLSVGEMNYIITKIVHAFIEHFDESYGIYNTAIGVLECVKQELYRRKITPYERKKIIENGDV